MAIRHRIHFEPVDVDNKTREQIELLYRDMKEKCEDGAGVYGSHLVPDINRIILIDEHGFPIEQLKTVK